jgi:hypothetical protein
VTLIVYGDFAIIADADMGALAPNMEFPGISWLEKRKHLGET